MPSPAIKINNRPLIATMAIIRIICMMVTLRYHYIYLFIELRKKAIPGTLLMTTIMTIKEIILIDIPRCDVDIIES